MRKILTDAAAIGNAAGRTLNWRPKESLGWSYYPGSMWINMLWQGGYNRPKYRKTANQSSC
jgi:hypothetical protein